MVQAALLIAVLMIINVSSFASAAADPAKVRNGKYQLFHLKNEAGASASFVLDLPAFHHRVLEVFTAPHGCNSEIDIYASINKQPTTDNYDYVSKVNKIGETNFLLADLFQQGKGSDEDVYILVNSKQAPGELCSVYMVAYARHNTHMITLEPSVPQWSAFKIESAPQKPYIQWFEYDLGKEDPEIEGMNIYLTSVEGQVEQKHYDYKVFVSNDNARPTQANHQWASLSMDDGDAFIELRRTDPFWRGSGKYYIAVALQENPQSAINKRPLSFLNATPLVHFTTVVQLVKKSQSRPILLFDRQPQVGAGIERGYYSQFSFYVDTARVNEIVKLGIVTRTGKVVVYVSSKTTTPSKIDHEYSFDGFNGVLDMVFHQPSFVYVTVEASTSLSTYDLEFMRE